MSDEKEQIDPINKTHWYGANLDVDSLVESFNKDEIYWPAFQRKFIWKKPQASRLIESILIGLPIPSIFLYKAENDRHPLIIDGLQRMITLSAFKKGYWPSEGNSRPFKLVGLLEGSKFIDKTYDKLENEDKEKFDNALIHVLFIEQPPADHDHSSVLHIFDRLNSGGTPLNPQELRNAFYGGAFRKLLSEMSENGLWRKCYNKFNKRGEDQELILRFLALLYNGENYKQPMKSFLNTFMDDHKNDDGHQFRKDFIETLDRLYEALGDDVFRSNNESKSFSTSYFDAFMVAVATNKSASSEAISKAHGSLQNSEEFKKYTGSTTKIDAVQGRIRMVKESLNGRF